MIWNRFFEKSLGIDLEVETLYNFVLTVGDSSSDGEKDWNSQEKESKYMNWANSADERIIVGRRVT